MLPPARTLRPLTLRRSEVAAVLLAACTALGLLFATHFRFYYRIDWSLALWWGLKDWYLWGALAPGIVWITRRLPLSDGRWPAALAVHLLAALTLALVHPVLAISLSALAEGLRGAPFLEAVEGLFLKRYAVSFLVYGAVAALTHAVDAYRRGAAGDGSREEWAGRLAEELRRGSPEAAGALDAAGAPEAAGASEAAGVSETARPAERLLVRSADRERFLPVERIDRIEAEGNYVRIHVGGESFLERRTLKSLEDQLEPSRFLRIHRSHLVNVERIDRIEPRFKGGYEVILRDGTGLALSRTYRKRLEERIGESF